MQIDKEGFKAKLQWLRGEDGVASESVINDAIGDILLPLLAAEGLELQAPKNRDKAPIDYAARRSNDRSGKLSVAIEYKHRNRGRAIEARVVQQLLGKIAAGPFDRALIISRTGFTNEAVAIADEAPLIIELHDLQTLSDWVDRVSSDIPHVSESVAILVKTLSHEFAKLVATDSSVLDHLEWRDVERMMSRVMSGLGFDVTLTPSSKDGGKDLILRCQAGGKGESYIVELKHWRAGNRVGESVVTDFFRVIAKEGREGGLILSTSGYTSGASEAVTRLSTNRLRIGGKTKIIKLCETYMRADSGLWHPPDELPEILFEEIE